MNLYLVCRALHLAASFLWLGHMFFWSIFAGPAVKRVHPSDTAMHLRALSLRMGGLGWPALIILVATGAYMLSARGIGVAQLTSIEFLDTPSGRVLMGKLALVVGMVGYQLVFGHRPAPRAIHANMAVALLVLLLSVLVRWGA